MDTLNKGEFFHLLAIPKKERLLSVLKYMLDEDEFLSPYGIRSLSKVHRDHPFEMHVGGEKYDVGYVPGEGNTYAFGGNSNWRGPVWLCGKGGEGGEGVPRAMSRPISTSVLICTL